MTLASGGNPIFPLVVLLVRVECVNVSSPVGCVLSLFYLCAFQMSPVCVVTSEGVFVCLL